MKHSVYLLLCLFLITFHESKSQNISVLGQWNNNPNFLIKYRQDRLIVTTAGGIRFLDVSNPYAPVSTSASISNPPNGEFSFAVETEGNYAYFAGSYYGHFRIVDITNIDAPVQKGIIYNVLGTAYQIGIQGNYAYVATNNDTLYSIDISNKTAPVLIHKIDLGAQPRGTCINGNYAYISTGNGIKIVDITNPSSMNIVTTFGSGNYGKIEADLPNNRIFVTDPAGGFTVLNTSNPANLTNIYSQTGGFGSLTYNNSKLFQYSSQPSAFQINAGSSSFLCSLASPLSGQVNDIDSKDSIFYVSTVNSVYVLQYSSTSVVTSLNAHNQTTLASIYPNPANDRLMVKCSSDIEKAAIHVTNNLGETLGHFNYSKDGSDTFDISHLASGIYFMTISSGSSTEKLKFIKD
jgi:hypothetical protein